MYRYYVVATQNGWMIWWQSKRPCKYESNGFALLQCHCISCYAALTTLRTLLYMYVISNNVTFIFWQLFACVFSTLYIHVFSVDAHVLWLTFSDVQTTFNELSLRTIEVTDPHTMWNWWIWFVVVENTQHFATLHFFITCALHNLMINESIPQNGKAGRADMEKQDRKRRQNVKRGWIPFGHCGTWRSWRPPFRCVLTHMYVVDVPGLFCDPYIAATSLEGGKSSQARTDNGATTC